MKKGFVKWEKLIVTLAIACVLAVCYLLRVPCLFQYITGLPCPSCGMTRAWLSVLRLDIAAALDYHYLFWTVPILYLFFWFDGALFKKKQLDRIILFGILAAFCMRWIAVLASHLDI
jgi:hypothetical protein